MKIALIQSKPKLGNKKANINYMKKCIEKNNADLFVFPELYLTGYLLRDDLITIAETIEGKSVQKIKNIAKDNDCHIIFGMPEKSVEIHGLLYNSAVFVHPDDNVDCYRKWYLANFGPFQEKRYFAKGNELNIYNTRFGKVGILICYDIFHPGICKVYSLQGADILIGISASPSTTRIYFEKVILARAIENTCFFLYSNLVGTEESMTFWGGNTIVDPKGEIIAKGKYFEEDTVLCSIDTKDINLARQFRPVVRDYRPEVYEKLRKL